MVGRISAPGAGLAIRLTLLLAVPAELAERVVYGQEAVEALVSLDWGYVAESRSGLTERWNKEILGG